MGLTYVVCALGLLGVNLGQYQPETPYMRYKKIKNNKMTTKSKSGTLSTTRSSDKKIRSPKEVDVAKRMKELLGINKIRFLDHANKRMGERNIIDYEVRQALSNGKHDPSNDRYSDDWDSWEYSIEGKTLDNRQLRIGISFENTSNGERLLVITVIDPNY